MRNITPDTRFQWIGGCWTAMPSAPKTAATNAGATQSLSAPLASVNELVHDAAPRATGHAECEHSTAKAA